MERGERWRGRENCAKAFTFFSLSAKDKLINFLNSLMLTATHPLSLTLCVTHPLTHSLITFIFTLSLTLSITLPHTLPLSYSLAHSLIHPHSPPTLLFTHSLSCIPSLSTASILSLPLFFSSCLPVFLSSSLHSVFSPHTQTSVSTRASCCAVHWTRR